LGYGHLEKVYLNALIYELNKLGLKVESQKPIEVHYENTIIGKYYADLRVEDKHIIELKTAARILRNMKLNYYIIRNLRKRNWG
jgi:GxxExxY protein